MSTPIDYELDDLFQALAASVRRDVLAQLRQGPAATNDLLSPHTMTPHNLMAHLRRLETGGLVESSKQGRERFYALRPGSFAPALRWMRQQEELWPEEQEGEPSDLPRWAEDSTALTVTRVLRAPRPAVWRCLTEPDLLRQWFAPRPAEVTGVEIEPRAGGRFYTVIRYMGQSMPGDGLVLEIVEQQRLTWTNMLLTGWRPAAGVDLPFTATIEIADHVEGTIYRAAARHPDTATAERHEALGFSQGWGLAAEQLGRLAATLT
ncbi:ArsR/SmtB family transcription factor [Rubellimicrobium roseum]|uniref:Helix-turn-helix domain-containing protein n=1 Tax=Rubellimicrobium roseum TaxID=687525 RepID=A0A5C4NGI2_9RHOB|nr:SRPBCC domain-containing protein [Rubellimicrobium roseum]TNC73841.1 helix-turn-helix domain-containing protein [Rubellimicrobium roseum]